MSRLTVFSMPAITVFLLYLHSESFPGSGLAVSEDGAVEAGENRVDEIAKSLVVQIHLPGGFVVNRIEGERLGRIRRGLEEEE